MVNKLVDKIKITGSIEVLTGMHIGGSSEFSAIGAVDSIVIKDPLTQQPIIPGSSLKGKLRYLLAKYKSENSDLAEVGKDPEEIKRLFGASEPVVEARLQFADLFLNKENAEMLNNSNLDLSYTEIKFENTINREDAKATPRQQERVVRGSIFDFSLTYNVENENELQKDFENIKTCFKILENDYLGGSGSRGYGRVKFNELKCESKLGVINDIPSLQD